MGNESEVSTGDSVIPQISSEWWLVAQKRLYPSQIKPISTENETKNIKFITARAELSCRTYFLKYGNDQSLYATCCKWHRVAAAVQIKSLFFWKALVSETLVAMSPNC